MSFANRSRPSSSMPSSKLGRTQFINSQRNLPKKTTIKKPNILSFKKTFKHNDEDETSIPFQTTNQAFQDKTIHLKKFQNFLQDLKGIPAPCENKENIISNKAKKYFFNIREDDNCSQNSEVNTDHLFEPADNDFKIKKFLESFPQFSQSQMMDLMKDNLDYFLHFFNFCNCSLCSCGICKCDFIKKSVYLISDQSTIKFKFNPRTTYNAHFTEKAFDQNTMYPNQGKEDNLWQFYPPEFKSTYSRFFDNKSKKQYTKLEKELSKKRPGEEIFSKTLLGGKSTYQVKNNSQGQFIDRSKVQQCLRSYRGNDMIPNMNNVKLNSTSEYRDKISVMRKGMQSARACKDPKRYPFYNRIPFGTQGNIGFNKDKQFTFNNKDYNKSFNNKMMDSLVSQQDARIKFRHILKHNLEQEKNCIQLNNKQKIKAKDHLLKQLVRFYNDVDNESD